MDPVTVFNALYDTKCLKFGKYDLKSGLVAPYYINLRRLPLYPGLMDAIVTQVTEKFLSGDALVAITSQLVRENSIDSKSMLKTAFSGNTKSATDRQISVDSCFSSATEKSPATSTESDSDSHLDEDYLDASSQDSEWDNLTESLDPILCGVPYGAVPLGAAIAYKARLPFLMERKEDKAYGDQTCLMSDFNDETRRAMGECLAEESPVQKRQRVILIEDVVCSGESILDTVRKLEKRNLKVEFVICIVDREENGVSLLMKEEGIRVLSLYKISAILRVLEATGRINHEQFVETRKWITSNQFAAIGVDPTKDTPKVQASATAEKILSQPIVVASN